VKWVSFIRPTTAVRGSDMGTQMQQPLAVAVMGGFVAGLPLLLMVLPALMRGMMRGIYR